MSILIIAEKKTIAQPFVDALKKKHAHVEYLRISKITLVSKHGATIIKALGKEIPQYDAAFIQVRPSLAPFIEPLLEEFANETTYTTAKRGSYYIALNEPYQFVTLATAGIPSPRTISSGSAKNIDQLAKKISYPLLAKSFIAKKAQQALIVNTSRELSAFIKSIKTDIDGFMLREFIEHDVISCVVVGRKVFAIRRKYRDGVVADIPQGETYKPTESEEHTAINAAHACGLDIARVDMSKGRVVKVDPTFSLPAFNTICSDNLEDTIAQFLIDKALTHEHKKILPLDPFKLIIAILKKTPLGRWIP